MRIEASREEWKRLYQLAVECKDIRKELLKGIDFFSIYFSEEEIIYFSVLGNDHMCTGFSMYQGREGLNDLMGLIFAEKMNLDFYDMVTAQNCISMRFGNRGDVSREQYQIISDLNLKFRGDGNWIYFDTCEKGFYPYICNQKEVLSATRYLEKFIEGVRYYKNSQCQTDLKKGQFFEYYCENGIWGGRINEISAQQYHYSEIHITDDFTKAKLKRAGKIKTGMTVEIKTFYYAQGVRDRNYDKIIVPKIAAVADHYGGSVIDYQTILPDEDSDNKLALILSEWIYQYGCPKEIIVPDSVTAALIEDVCRICQVKLTKGEVSVIEEFRASVKEDIESGLEKTPEPPKKEKKEYDFELLERLGFDLEDIKRKSEEMTEQELLGYIMDLVNGVLKKIYEEQELFVDDFDIPVFQAELKNRKEKIQAVRDFYGQGEIAGADMNQFYREIWIDYSITSWMDMLRESRKTELTALANKIGISESRSMAKEQLIREIQNRVETEPRLLADSMSSEEKSLLKYLWKKARRNGFEVELEEFPSDMDTILKLLAMGVIDIGLEYDEYESDLLLEPIKEVEQMLKKWM